MQDLIVFNAKSGDPSVWGIDEVSNQTMVLLDLGLEPSTVIDPIQTRAHTLAIEEFEKRLLVERGISPAGLLIYQGAAQFDHPRLEPLFEEWESTFSFRLEPAYAKRLFALDLLMDYLHRLVSSLPSDLDLFVDLDLSDITAKSRLAQLLSPERYPFIRHLHRDLDPHPLGICLPSDERLDAETHRTLEEALSSLVTPYQILPEKKLFEMWSGVEHLIVPTQSIDLETKRSLRGFNASGGSVVHIGPPMDIPYQEPFESFLNRHTQGDHSNPFDF